MSVETIILPLVGGILIGLSSIFMMYANGRIAGISGIFSGVLPPQATSDMPWKGAFVGGLLVGGLALLAAMPSVYPSEITTPLPFVILAGLLVGFGTRLGSGCTSGHGVCGMSRLSPRSIIATVTFIVTGAATVFLMQNVMGGAA